MPEPYISNRTIFYFTYDYIFRYINFLFTFIHTVRLQ